MEAVLRINTFETKNLRQAMRAMQELEHAHADFPGYLGTLTVDLGEGRVFVANLWSSEKERLAGLAGLGALADRLLTPLLAKPSELVGIGTIVSSNAAVPLRHSPQADS